MADFRIETVSHPVTGKVALEVYHPEDPSKLLVASDYIYHSHETARADLVRIFQKAFPGKDIDHGPASPAN
jgi:hypothetical protein